MRKPHAALVVTDVRKSGYIASMYEHPNGEADVLIATPWGTERLETYEAWLAHVARKREHEIPKFQSS